MMNISDKIIKLIAYANVKMTAFLGLNRMVPYELKRLQSAINLRPSLSGWWKMQGRYIYIIAVNFTVEDIYPFPLFIVSSVSLAGGWNASRCVKHAFEFRVFWRWEELLDLEISMELYRTFRYEDLSLMHASQATRLFFHAFCWQVGESSNLDEVVSTPCMCYHLLTGAHGHI